MVLSEWFILLLAVLFGEGPSAISDHVVAHDGSVESDVVAALEVLNDVPIPSERMDVEGQNQVRLALSVSILLRVGVPRIHDHQDLGLVHYVELVAIDPHDVALPLHILVLVVTHVSVFGLLCRHSLAALLYK